MRYFPQLETKTAGQYPLRRVRRERVVAVESLDGAVSSYYDPDAARVEWQLTCEGLTDAEKTAVDELFEACEGRLQTFLFLDPAANLLRWSEDFGQTVWVRGPLLNLTTAQADPWGTTRASRLMNTGSADQSLAQTIGTPGKLQYCASVYARGGAFRLRIDSGGVVIEQPVAASGSWQRYVVSGMPGSAAETVTFSVVLGAGEEVDLCGMQAETQPAPSGYRRSMTRSGVYANARFGSDILAWTRQAPNENAAQLTIVSRPQ